MKQTLMKDLNEMPQIICDKAIELYNKKMRLEEMQLALKLIEKNKYAEVEAIVDEKGKSMFSNIEKRNDERDRQLKENQSYQSQLTERDNLQIEIDHDSINMEFLRNRFTACKAMARLFGDE